MGKIMALALDDRYAKTAYLDENGEAHLAENMYGTYATATAIYMDENHDFVTGEEAKFFRFHEMDSYVDGIRGLMEQSDPPEFLGKNPTELMAILVERLQRDMERVLSERVTGVVYSLPVYWTWEQWRRLETAIRQSNMEVRGCITEPVAAFLHYYPEVFSEKTQKRSVLVFYVGDERFDASVVDYQDEAIRIISCDGDEELGLNLWEEETARFFRNEIGNLSGGMADFYDPEMLYQIYSKSSLAVEKLMERDETCVIISVKPHQYRITLTAEQLAENTEHMVNRMLEIAGQCIENARNEGYEVDEIVLSGSGCRLPQIQKKIAEKFDLSIRCEEPENAIVKGTALYTKTIQEILPRA